MLHALYTHRTIGRKERRGKGRKGRERRKQDGMTVLFKGSLSLGISK